MKIVTTIAGIILASAFATTANAGPSKSEVMTQCKTEIKGTFEDVTRIRTNRMKERASGTYVTYKVSFEDAESQKVTCTFSDGIASLTDADGVMIAGKTETENTGS